APSSRLASRHLPLVDDRLASSPFYPPGVWQPIREAGAARPPHRVVPRCRLGYAKRVEDRHRHVLRLLRAARRKEARASLAFPPSPATLALQQPSPHVHDRTMFHLPFLLEFSPF